MPDVFSYSLIVRQGAVFEGDDFDAPEGSVFTGTYRDAPSPSGNSVSLPSVGATAGSDVYAEVRVGRHGQAAPGGSGVPIVRKFPFAFDTPGLLTGHPVYTPTVGDILLDAWIQIDTAWNGITPNGDIGQFVGTIDGMFGGNDMTKAWMPNAGSGYLAQNVNNSLARSGEAPGMFTSTDPMRVVVTRTSEIGGGDPGSTQGEAVLYLVTCTPA